MFEKITDGTRPKHVMSLSCRTRGQVTAGVNTVGPAMSLSTSCWLLPQNEQWSGFLVSPLLTLFISESRQDTSHHSRNRPNQAHTRSTRSTTRRRERWRRLPLHQLSRKLLRILDRLGCLSLRSALASIWRMRSRVTENWWPTSSSVWSL